MMPPKRKSAFNAALQEAQQRSDTVPKQGSDTVITPHGETVKPLERPTATQEESDTVSPFHSPTVQEEQRTELSPFHSETVGLSKDQFSRKVSFYLTPRQEKKLDDLADDYRRQHEGKRINRNDIVRHLINHCTLESLESLEE
jgi:hypothetical protein